MAIWVLRNWTANDGRCSARRVQLVCTAEMCCSEKKQKITDSWSFSAVLRSADDSPINNWLYFWWTGASVCILNWPVNAEMAEHGLLAFIWALNSNRFQLCWQKRVISVRWGSLAVTVPAGMLVLIEANYKHMTSVLHCWIPALQITVQRATTPHTLINSGRLQWCRPQLFGVFLHFFQFWFSIRWTENSQKCVICLQIWWNICCVLWIDAFSQSTKHALPSKITVRLLNILHLMSKIPGPICL